MTDKILVIEDERNVLKNTLDILVMEGFDAYGADNGRAGVNLAFEQRPDLIICDIAMPEMSGYEVLAEVRRHRKTALVPFIFLTARTERSDIRRGMNLGADDYLTKPFSVGELLESVHARLEKKAAIEAEADTQLDELREKITLSLPHELRTPLTSILGFSDILLMDGLTLPGEQVVKMSRYINDAGVRLSRLTENYLAYAQLEILELDDNRRNALVFSTSQAGDFVEFAARQVAQRTHRETDLLVEVRPAVVQMQEDYLKKITEELVDNAFKFSAPGSPVTLKTSERDGVWCMEITNQGRGMTEAQIAQIGGFMQFERDRYEQQGLGLGLSIARRLAELHEGRLEVRSTPDVDLTVSVFLPLGA